MRITVKIDWLFQHVTAKNHTCKLTTMFLPADLKYFKYDADLPIKFLQAAI